MPCPNYGLSGCKSLKSRNWEMQFRTFWALNLVLFMEILVLTENKYFELHNPCFFLFHSFISRVGFRRF